MRTMTPGRIDSIKEKGDHILSLFAIRTAQTKDLNVSADLVGILMDLGFMAAIDTAFPLAEKMFEGMRVSA